MLINDALRREIGREAVRFCRRCPAVERKDHGDYTAYVCHKSECRLWAFLRLLGLGPGTDFDAPTAVEARLEEHAREVHRFRGVLPILQPDHDWEADARFHHLGAEVARLDSPGRPAWDEAPWRS
jgi:hypothetical protein